MLEPAQHDELLPNNWLLKGPGNSAAPLGAGAACVTFSHCPFLLNLPSTNITIVVKWETHHLKPMCPAQHMRPAGGALRSLHSTGAHRGCVSPLCHQVWLPWPAMPCEHLTRGPCSWVISAVSGLSAVSRQERVPQAEAVVGRMQQLFGATS